VAPGSPGRVAPYGKIPEYEFCAARVDKAGTVTQAAE
jgi:hypothetical protein